MFPFGRFFLSFYLFLCVLCDFDHLIWIILYTSLSAQCVFKLSVWLVRNCKWYLLNTESTWTKPLKIDQFKVKSYLITESKSNEIHRISICTIWETKHYEKNKRKMNMVWYVCSSREFIDININNNSNSKQTRITNLNTTKSVFQAQEQDFMDDLMFFFFKFLYFAPLNAKERTKEDRKNVNKYQK